MADNRIWLDAAFAEKDPASRVKDRNFGSGLFVDLVPSSCWFSNVRSCVYQRDWERLRRMITNRAGQRCEVNRRGKTERLAGGWKRMSAGWRSDHYDR